MSKKVSMMVGRFLVMVIIELVSKFIAALIVRWYNADTNYLDFLKDLQKRWLIKKEELIQRFSQSVSQSVSEIKQKTDPLKQEMMESISSKKKLLEDIIIEIREFFEGVIDDHFTKEEQPEVKKDFNKQLTKEFAPVMKKVVKEIKKSLNSLLFSVLTGGKKKKGLFN